VGGVVGEVGVGGEIRVADELCVFGVGMGWRRKGRLAVVAPVRGVKRSGGRVPSRGGCRLDFATARRRKGRHGRSSGPWRRPDLRRRPPLAAPGLRGRRPAARRTPKVEGCNHGRSKGGRWPSGVPATRGDGGITGRPPWSASAVPHGLDEVVLSDGLACLAPGAVRVEWPVGVGRRRQASVTSAGRRRRGHKVGGCVALVTGLRRSTALRGRSRGKWVPAATSWSVPPRAGHLHEAVLSTAAFPLAAAV